MKKKAFAAQCARVEAVIAKWQPILLPGDWCIHHTFLNDEGDGEYGAEVNSRWEYQLAHIAWSIPVLAGESDEKLEEDVIHEFVHCLVAQMKRRRGDAGKSEERVVTALARAFCRATGNGERGALLSEKAS